MSLLHNKCNKKLSSLNFKLEEIKKENKTLIADKKSIVDNVKKIQKNHKSVEKNIKLLTNDFNNKESLIKEIIEILKPEDKNVIALLTKYGYAKEMVLDLPKISILFRIDHNSGVFNRNIINEINLLPTILKSVKVLKNIELIKADTKVLDNKYFNPTLRSDIGNYRKIHYSNLKIDAKYMGSFEDCLSSINAFLNDNFRGAIIVYNKVDKQNHYCEIQLKKNRNSF